MRIEMPDDVTAIPQDESMSKRDMMAMMFALLLIELKNESIYMPDCIASQSYRLANAMISASRTTSV